MTKVLYQFTLLGLASSCLATLAYANSANDSDCDTCDDGVIFTVVPTFGPIACGAAARQVTWTIQNTGDTSVEVGDISFIIEAGDSFQDDADLLTLAAPAPGLCATGGILAPGNTCDIIGIIDPTTVDCQLPDDYISLPTTGVIDRELSVMLYNYQREIDEPVNFDMTFIGSAGEFSLLGGNICGEGDSEHCSQTLSAKDIGAIFAYQNVGVYETAGYLTDEVSESGLGIIYPPSNPVAVPVTNAHNDAIAAYDNLYQLSTEVVSALAACNSLPTDYFQNDPQIITSGVYCFNDGSPAPVAIDNTITVYGSDPLVFIIDFEDPDLESATPALQILNGSNFVFDETTGASAENIYWVVNGDVQMNTCTTCPSDDAVTFAGTLLINDGNFIVPDNSGPATFQGRVISINGDITLGDYYSIFP